MVNYDGSGQRKLLAGVNDDGRQRLTRPRASASVLLMEGDGLENIKNGERREME